MVALTCNHGTGEVGDQQPPGAYRSASLTVVFKLGRDPASKSKMGSNRDVTSGLHTHGHTCVLVCTRTYITHRENKLAD